MKYFILFVYFRKKNPYRKFNNKGRQHSVFLSQRLIIYGFTSRSRIFHLYGDVTIAGEGLQNLGLCSALRAFEQGGIFIMPHML
jgi:hypothetical protein